MAGYGAASGSPVNPKTENWVIHSNSMTRRQEMKRFIAIGLFFIMLGCAALANADTLTLNGTVSVSGGTGYFIYESGANITWYYVVPASSINGTLQSNTWANAGTWASGLTVGSTNAGSWSLPGTTQVLGTYPSSNVTSVSQLGQLGNLYYSVLGNTAGSFTNSGAFGTALTGILSGSVWTNVLSTTYTGYALMFSFNDGGNQELGNIASDTRGEIAVHTGDYGPNGQVVPIPAAILLFGSGLAGVGFVRRVRGRGRG